MHAGLHGLQELRLAFNKLSTLAPLNSLSALQQLDASHNQLNGLAGVQGMASLCALNLEGNAVRRLEALTPCCSLHRLERLAVAGNPLTLAQSARLHVIHLLSQVQACSCC
jgi:Leucine-rich repeat (LRR) protein